MKKIKVIKEFVDVERGVVVNVETFETRRLTADEQKKYNEVDQTQGAADGFQEPSR